jgi:uncharacterized protein (TIGR00375 family)
MKKVYADFHIHIGRNSRGKIVKMTGARNLTLENIALAAKEEKGIQLLGVVDFLSPHVIEDMEKMLEVGSFKVMKGGGLVYGDMVTILPGAEIEIRGESGKSAHCLAFFPYPEDIISFSKEMRKYIKNIYLSTQPCTLQAAELSKAVKSHHGLFIPAHLFTPFKSLYGNYIDRISSLFPGSLVDYVDGVELGLSADTELADRIRELRLLPFLSNSDAHSLGKIGREYNELWIKEPSFEEFVKALRGLDGRKILANYGLEPRLGKYYRTYCLVCEQAFKISPPVRVCPNCNNHEIIFGVLDRITEIQDDPFPVHPAWRPPYHYQIPLEFIPEVGEKTLKRLIQHFGNEMNILHRVGMEELSDVVGEKIAKNIIAGREGNLNIKPGGGGHYGRVVNDRGGVDEKHCDYSKC